MDTREEIEAAIEDRGVKYTSAVWQALKAKGKMLTPNQAELYSLVQKAHVVFTGNSLPPLPGAYKTRTQIRDQELPGVKDEVLDKAVKGGLAAKLAKMRK